MGVSLSIAIKMKSFALVLAFIASVSCDAYTIGQVAHGYTAGGLITGVDYGHGLVSGYGAIGNRGYYGYAAPAFHYGKRDAEPYTIGQVAAGLPVANAYATGHPHNVGHISYVSHGYTGYGHHGLVSGYGYPVHHIGKRDAEPYTIGQIAGGLHIANAYATGHPHNIGHVSYVSHGYPTYGFYH